MIKVYNTGPIIRNFKGYEINSGVCYLTIRLLEDLKKDKNMSELIDNNIIIVEEEKINAYFKVETTLNYLENLDIETLNNIDIESAKFFNKDIEALIENLKIIKTPFLHEAFNRLETKINNIKDKLSKAKANKKEGGGNNAANK